MRPEHIVCVEVILDETKGFLSEARTNKVRLGHAQ